MPLPILWFRRAPVSPRSAGFGLLAMLDHLVGQASGQFREVIEAPLEARHALALRAQFQDQVVDLGFREVGGHLVPARPAVLGVEAENLAAAAGQDRSEEQTYELQSLMS